MNKEAKDGKASLARKLIWLCGLLLILTWIYAHWHAPVLFGFGEQRLEAEGPVKVWLVRLLYIHVLLLAVYREWAEFSGADFPPYNLFVLIIVACGPIFAVCAVLRYG